MADLEFFFDPVCPWAWITSRWVREVQQLRDYKVTWRFISLTVVNEDRDVSPEYLGMVRAGHESLRVADAVLVSAGNEAVGRFYTELGTAIHTEQRGGEGLADPDGFLAAALVRAGLDPALAAHRSDDSHDSVVRSDTALALSRTGPDVGTPILTFHPGRPDEGSFFGPVISSIPRGDEALKLWDAVETLATSGVSELKRSLRAAPAFD